jgi:hypothetical protein
MCSVKRPERSFDQILAAGPEIVTVPKLIANVLFVNWIDAHQREQLSQMVAQLHQKGHEAVLPEQQRKWQTNCIERNGNNGFNNTGDPAIRVQRCTRASK